MEEQMDRESTPYFDIILHYTSHRRHEIYLNIVKYLGREYKIGLLFLTKSRKWNNSDDVYLEMCQKAGAEIIEGPAECDCLMLSRLGNEGSVHFTDAMEKIPKLINYRKVLLWPAGYLCGVLEVEKLVKEFKNPTILVPNMKLFGFLEPEVLDYLKDNPLELVEVGFPYGQYPIIEGFKADYLVAYPSHVLVKEMFRQYSLLNKLVNILKTIPEDALIYLKTHNARDHGSKVSYNFLAKYNTPFAVIKFIVGLIQAFDVSIFGKRIYQILPNKVLERLCRFFNDYIYTRCLNLLDEHPGFGIEHYLPHVKGLITAPSASINMALHGKIPVKLCDVIDENVATNYSTMYSLYEMNTWEGFSSKGFEKISDESRKADLMEVLKRLVKKGKKKGTEVSVGEVASLQE